RLTWHLLPAGFRTGSGTEFEGRGAPMRRWLLATASLVTAAWITPPCRATTLHVPAVYPTIQDALGVSGVGDTVLVAPGTYSGYTLVEDFAFVANLPDGVSLVSEAGPSQTVIDLAPLEGVAYSSVAFGAFFHSTGQTVIDGFRVVGMPSPSAGASVAYSAHVEIRNCVFESPIPADGSTSRKGISSRETDLRVTNCTFIRCSGDDGAGIFHLYAPLVVESCTFIECADQAIRSEGGSGTGPWSSEIRDSVFLRNTSMSGGGAIALQTQPNGAEVTGCVFVESEVVGNVGAAALISGNGPKTVSNNVFRNFNLADGAAVLSMIDGTAEVTGNTFVDIQQPAPPPRPPVITQTTTMLSVVFQNNIVAHTSGEVAIDGGPEYTSGCNVFWDNADGIGLDLDPTDRIVDPQFCDPDNRDYTLQATSPCLPPLSLGCDLIGALEQGCGTISVTPSTWGRIKSNFRTGEE
ncbi:right-handed parallel beta-helix repeat-containing protein, partial [bacterium]|nr:right-handed parallel beta-helix repeat-containing protein [bacterium]